MFPSLPLSLPEITLRYHQFLRACVTPPSILMRIIILLELIKSSCSCCHVIHVHAGPRLHVFHGALVITNDYTSFRPGLVYEPSLRRAPDLVRTITALTASPF